MTKHKILVIDDDDGIQGSIRDYFEVTGFEIRVASTGATGLQMALDERPNVAGAAGGQVSTSYPLEVQTGGRL